MEGEEWSDADVERLLTLRFKWKLSHALCAESLGRTKFAVQHKLRELAAAGGLPPAKSVGQAKPTHADRSRRQAYRQYNFRSSEYEAAKAALQREIEAAKRERAFAKPYKPPPGSL